MAAFFNCCLVEKNNLFTETLKIYLSKNKKPHAQCFQVENKINFINFASKNTQTGYFKTYIFYLFLFFLYIFIFITRRKATEALIKIVLST